MLGGLAFVVAHHASHDWNRPQLSGFWVEGYDLGAFVVGRVPPCVVGGDVDDFDAQGCDVGDSGHAVRWRDGHLCVEFMCQPEGGGVAGPVVIDLLTQVLVVAHVFPVVAEHVRLLKETP